MKWLKYFWVFTTFILLLILIFQRRPQDTIELGKRSIKIQKEYVPVINKITYHIPGVGKKVHDTVYLPKYIVRVEKEKIDTGAILAAYFKKIFYDDTLVKNDTIFVNVKDTISQNRIISRRFTIKVRPMKLPEKGHLFIGGSLGGNLNAFDSYFGVMYAKKRGMFGAMYSPMSKSVQFNLYYKIK